MPVTKSNFLNLFKIVTHVAPESIVWLPLLELVFSFSFRAATLFTPWSPFPLYQVYPSPYQQPVFGSFIWYGQVSHSNDRKTSFSDLEQSSLSVLLVYDLPYPSLSAFNVADIPWRSPFSELQCLPQVTKDSGRLANRCMTQSFSVTGSPITASESKISVICCTASLSFSYKV